MSDTKQSWDGYQVEETRKKVSWAPAIKLVDEVVRLLPSYKDSRRGRSRAMQFKAVPMIAGIVVVVWAGRTWIVAGIFIMLLSLVLPIKELKKRSLRLKLKNAQTKAIEHQNAVSLVHDGRRLAIEIDGKMQRRVLLDKRNHSTEEGAYKGRRLLVVQGASNKKREKIWLVGPESGNDPEFTDDDVFQPVFVGAGVLDQILSAVEA